MSWNWVDAIVLILLIRGAYCGRRDGLSVELVKLGTVVATYYCAIKYYGKVALWIASHSRVPLAWSTVVAFLAIALSSLFVVWIFFKLLGKIVTLQFESQISTLGGMLVGTGRAAMVAALLLFALFFVPDPFVKKHIYTNSVYGKWSTDATPKLYIKFSHYMKEAGTSSEAILAQYEKEKARMALWADTNSGGGKGVAKK